MKTMEKEKYDAPQMEVVWISVEQGFSLSETHNGIEDMPEHDDW